MQFTFRSALAALALAAMSQGCAVAPNGEASIALQPTGATIVSEARSTGSYGSGTTKSAVKRMGKREWQGKELYAVQVAADGTEVLMTADGGWVAFVKGGRPLVTYDPPLGYPFPLKVGASTIAKTTMTDHATNQAFPVEVQFTIEAYEDVTTPAGTFKAFRIRSVDNGGNDNINWYNVDLATHVKQKLTRLPANSKGPGTRDIELISTSGIK